MREPFVLYGNLRVIVQGISDTRRDMGFPRGLTTKCECRMWTALSAVRFLPTFRPEDPSTARVSPYRSEDLDHVLVDGEHVAPAGDVLDQEFADKLVAQAVTQPLDAGGPRGLFAVGF